MGCSEGLAAVKRAQVDRRSFRQKPGKQAQNRAGAILVFYAGGFSQMRLGAKYLVYHSCAGGLRSELHKNSGAVLIGAAYEGGEIKAVYGLRHDRVGGALPGDLIGFFPGAAVKAHSRGGRSSEEVKVPVLFFHQFGRGEMYRGDALQRQEYAA